MVRITCLNSYSSSSLRMKPEAYMAICSFGSTTSGTGVPVMMSTVAGDTIS